MYVERNGQGKIISVFNNPQSGYAEEWVEDSDQEIVDFFNPPKTKEEMKADIKAQFTDTVQLMAVSGDEDALNQVKILADQLKALEQQ